MGAHRALAVLFFYLGNFRKICRKIESEDELEGLAALFFEHERKPAVRIRGYVEEVVANLSDDRFKRVFCLSCLQGASREQ